MPAKSGRKVTVVLPSVTPMQMGEGFEVIVQDQYGNTVVRFAPPQDRRNKSQYRVHFTYTGEEDVATKIIEQWQGDAGRKKESDDTARANAPAITKPVDAIMRLYARNEATVFASLREKLMLLIGAAVDLYGWPAMPTARHDEYAAMPVEVLRGLLHFRFPEKSFPEFGLTQNPNTLAHILTLSIAVPFAAIDERWLELDAPTDTDARILKELFVDLGEYKEEDCTPDNMLLAMKGIARTYPEFVARAPHRDSDEERVSSSPHTRIYKCHYFRRYITISRFVSSSTLRFSNFPVTAKPFYPRTQE